MGVAALIVAFLCWFILKEPEGSFADHHQGEEEEDLMAQSYNSAEEIIK